MQHCAGKRWLTANAGAHPRAEFDGVGSNSVSPSGPAHWQPILEKLGVSTSQSRAIAMRAKLMGVPFQVELLASGVVKEAALYRGLAKHLGLGFLSEVRSESLLMSESQAMMALKGRGSMRAAAIDRTCGTALLIAPDRLDIPSMQRYLRRYPRVAALLRIVPPSVLRRAIRGRARESLLRTATNGLFETAPAFSARFVLDAWQGITLGALFVLLTWLLALRTHSTVVFLHAVLSTLFLGCITLRVAASGGKSDKSAPVRLHTPRAQDLPVYTVLVALYKEADVVSDLLLALSRLVWPRSKLEIKLVCESDDEETLAAIRAHELHSCVEVIEVPPGGPRTKPKALSYALPLTTGEFLVLYDAEDKPHPLQLLEAWQRFHDGDENLACLQAPLVITNRHESWIANMFAFEYSALFRGLLPWLARLNLMLPLGGTSNHFRRAVLEKIGGWDPCNVTEDADLGLRLARLGYRTGTITYPTYEDAPTVARVWLPQRTRWFKGWAQTWLVHMRDVPRLYREIGPASFLVTQILSAGMWISALAYSVFVVTLLVLAAYVLAGYPLILYHRALFVLDAANIIFGHCAFLALGWKTLSVPERRGAWRYALLTPAYWMLLSVAAWRALWQLYRCPHVWEKTPHRKRGTLNQRNLGPDETASTSASPVASRSRSV